MTKILGIDPGRNRGWAIADDGQLVKCGLAEPPVEAYTHIYIEIPQVYPGTRAKEANDLIKVAVDVGRMCGKFSDWENAGMLHLIFPHAWKGSVPKKIHNARILASLTDAEKARVPQLSESKLHNVIDAIGLAKWGFRAQNLANSIARRPRSLG